MRLGNFCSPKNGRSMLAFTCFFIFLANSFVALAFVGSLPLRAALLPTTINSAEHELKPIGDFRKDLKAFLKRSKQKDNPAQRYGAMIDLCQLHHQIVSDQRYSENRQLISFRAVAGERLKKCIREIEVQIKRDARESAKRARQAKADASKDRSGGDEQNNESKANEPPSLETLERKWLVEDMELATQLSGGPIRLWSHTGGHFAGPLCDHGPDLVRLIENTISPDSWQNNGGNGVIEYYQPLRILVVSASSKVHDDMTALLTTLRNNSR